MDIIIALISVDIIMSKFLDCYIKSNRFESNHEERNPVYRRILSVLGVDNNIWLSFLLTVLTVGVGVHLLNTFYSSTPFQLLFIFTGLFSTVLNLGSAHSAYFGRTNLITKKLLRVKN